jgi:AGZA family xanthine/uracil permease-like MFS transporter
LLSRCDFTESIPPFLIIIGIPLSYSIADGLALGFINCAIITAFSGRGREISWLTYVLAIVLVL